MSFCVCKNCWQLFSYEQIHDAGTDQCQACKGGKCVEVGTQHLASTRLKVIGESAAFLETIIWGLDLPMNPNLVKPALISVSRDLKDAHQELFPGKPLIGSA